MTTLLVEETTDYTAQAIENVKVVDFSSALGPATATILSTQFDNSGLGQLPTLIGGEYSDTLVIRIDLQSPELNWAFWNLDDWTANDKVLIEGSAAADNIQNNRSTQKSINGGAGDDTISGGSSEGDRLSGGAGNDRIFTSVGNHVNGGVGKRDHLDISFFQDLDVVFDLTANGGVWRGPGTTIKNIEIITFRGGEGDEWVTGGRFADVITGGWGDDKLYGGAGDDSLSGELGSNLIDGGLGNDRLSGGASGRDIIDGGEGIDTITFFPNPFPEVINFDIDISDGGGGRDAGNGSTLANVERMAFQGSDGHDSIVGGALDDILSGNVGDDRLIGGNGDDLLDGWTGSDVLRGGAGSDKIKFRYDGTGSDKVDGGGGIDTLELEVDFQLTESIVINVGIAGGEGSVLADGTTIKNMERLILWSGSGNDTITGGNFEDDIRSLEGADVIDGGAGNDVVSGGEGDDVITGGYGSDELSGEEGADRFVYSSVKDSGRGARADTIDFSFGDLLDLSAIDAIEGIVGSSFTFIGTQAFSGDAGELRYVQKGFFYAIVLGDTDGDRIADLTINLENVSFLSEVNLLL